MTSQDDLPYSTTSSRFCLPEPSEPRCMPQNLLLRFLPFRASSNLRAQLLAPATAYAATSVSEERNGYFFSTTTKLPRTEYQVMRCKSKQSWTQRVLTRSPDTLTQPVRQTARVAAMGRIVPRLRMFASPFVKIGVSFRCVSQRSEAWYTQMPGRYIFGYFC